MKKFILAKYKKIKRFLKLNYRIFVYITLIISLILNIYMIYKFNNQQMQYFISVLDETKITQNIELYYNINNNLSSSADEYNKYFLENLSWIINNDSLYVPSKFISLATKTNVVNSLNSSSSIISMLEFRNELLNQDKKNYIIILENIVSLLEN
uniref:hypothetical protein n=1 Tax=Neopestalotiopsis cubana TaxID=1562163 RepID=UPI00233E6EB2|nr:hypothetical protein PQ570_mgp19 [Neopestalotiopsis cubana]WBU13056.1 hypothetical protein [Neopestalotiopsis cubana]